MLASGCRVIRRKATLSGPGASTSQSRASVGQQRCPHVGRQLGQGYSRFFRGDDGDADQRHWLVARIADVAGRGVVRVDDGIALGQGDLHACRNLLAGTIGPGTLHPQRRLEAKGVYAGLDDLGPNARGDGLAAALTEQAA